MKHCRFCHTPLDAKHGVELVLDLGATPLANDLKVSREFALQAETYPLTMIKCGGCDGFQLTYAVDKELLFRDYHYSTPDMASLSKHYARVRRFLGGRYFDKVLEIGGNNGAFLRTFHGPFMPELKLNVEPALNISVDLGDANQKVTVREFFNHDLAFNVILPEYGKMDLIVARHCFAHIDDLDQVCRGVSEILNTRKGVFYIENAYVFATMFGLQFDQIYHEHMSYIALRPVQKLLERHGMRVFDVGFSDVHGGSIMIAACREEARFTDDLVPVWALSEQQHLFQEVNYEFTKRSKRRINELADMFTKFDAENKTVDIYGATAKSTTLLNVVKGRARRFNIRRCYDRAPLKIGKFLPGTGIPIVPEEHMSTNPPDFCFITAWNYADEIMKREKWYTKDFGGQWIVPYPNEIRVVS